jgi:hypothetical protein
MEMKSTPVSAMSRTVARVTLPEASSFAGEPRARLRSTAIRMSSAVNSSSMMMSAPAPSAASNSASDSTSTSTGMPGAVRRAAATAAAMDPAAMMWFSFTRIMS